MRITYFVATSLDGYIGGPQGQIDWLFTDGDYGYTAFLETVDAVAMGRATYDLTHTFGPDALPAGIPAYVFTHHPPEPGDASVHVVEGDVAAFAARLASQNTQHLWLLGGGVLAGAFLAAGLITDYVVSIHPVMLGAGVPLFKGGYTPATLRLTSHEVYPNGLVQLTYRDARAG